MIKTDGGRNAIFNSNRMKLGTFGTNGRGGVLTTAPDAHKPTWEATLRAAKLADAAGFEALLAFARWKGFTKASPDHPSGVVLDPFTWAAGIAQATSYSTVFATTHAPTIHPIVAAKQSATIDIISGGRFGLNVVGGWNKPEFDMFGSQLAAHDKRYEHLEEWLHVLKRLWTEKDEFDHRGEFLTLKGAVSRPQPVQKPKPPIMNAGGSPRGQRFACEHADMCFVSLEDEDHAAWKRQIDSYKVMAREQFGREISVWTVAGVVQRETREEAEAYLHYYAVENEDKIAVQAFTDRVTVESQGRTALQLQRARHRLAAAAGGQLLVGTAEDIAEGFQSLSDIGIDGCLLAWNNFADGLERFAEVMPLLESRGLREPFRAAASISSPASSAA